MCALKLPSAVKVHMAAGRCDALMAHWRLVSPRLVRAVREAGGELYVWTVDDGPRIGRLERLGVTGVITNDPRLFAQLPSTQVGGGVAGRVGARAGAVAGLGGQLGLAWQRVAAAPAEAHDAAQRDRLGRVREVEAPAGLDRRRPSRCRRCASRSRRPRRRPSDRLRRRSTGRGSASSAARPSACPASTRGCRSRRAAWRCRRRSPSPTARVPSSRRPTAGNSARASRAMSSALRIGIERI